jgi:hypothetical protein
MSCVQLMKRRKYYLLTEGAATLSVFQMALTTLTCTYFLVYDE